MGECNIFLSWSGPTSKLVAQAWHQWLPLAIQGARPWMSSTDIPKGTPWFGELADQLQGIRIGIICVTPENLTAPSIHFEAGALSKTVAEKCYVCPYLFNLKDSDLVFPLAHFQTTKAQRDDTRQLFHTLNRALQTTLTKEQLDAIFTKWWPDLEHALNAIPPNEMQQPHRNDREILEEILALMRDLARGLSGSGQRRGSTPSVSLTDQRLEAIKSGMFQRSKLLASCLDPLSRWSVESGKAHFVFTAKDAWAADLLKTPERLKLMRSACEGVLGVGVEIEIEIEEGKD